MGGNNDHSYCNNSRSAVCGGDGVCACVFLAAVSWGCVSVCVWRVVVAVVVSVCDTDTACVCVCICIRRVLVDGGGGGVSHCVCMYLSGGFLLMEEVVVCACECFLPDPAKRRPSHPAPG